MARNSAITFWDRGPPLPVEPAEPPLPEGFDHDPRVMIRLKYALADYEQGWRRYLEAKAEYEAFGGKPKQITRAVADAEEALTRDPRRYVRSL